MLCLSLDKCEVCGGGISIHCIQKYELKWKGWVRRRNISSTLPLVGSKINCVLVGYREGPDCWLKELQQELENDNTREVASHAQNHLWGAIDSG